MKSMFTAQRAIPIGDFVGDELRIICYFEGSWGHLPTRMDNFVAKYTKWFGFATH